MLLTFPTGRRARGRGLLLATTTFAASWSSAFAADVSWINPGWGNFADASNWSPANVPVAGDTAVFGLSNGVHRIDFASDVVNQNLRYNAGSALFALNGHTYTLAPVANAQGRADFGTVNGRTAPIILSDGTLSSRASAVGTASG